MYLRKVSLNKPVRMVWNIDPAIFKVGFLELRYYGILFASGVMAAFYLTSYILTEKRVTKNQMDSLLIYVVAGIILGAHFIHLVFYEPESFLNNPVRIIQLGSGLASHGGLLGGCLGVYLFCRRNKKDFSTFLGAIFFGVPLAGAFVRIGNFFNSEIIGKPTESIFGIVFQRIDTVARHPSQLYEAVFLLLLFSLFFWLHKQKPRVGGFFFYAFVIAYFGFRFFIEFTKEHQSSLNDGTQLLTMGQWLSIPAVLVGIYFLKSQKTVDQ